MIKLDSVHIEEFRGIRSLDLQLDRKPLVVVGPNGSGKSGVVDAIEFGLTGTVSRLSGSGTGGLSIGSHGPHVDVREEPDQAFVRLEVYLPDIEKTATITRHVSDPKNPKLEPNEDDVRSVLEEVAAHPEITLTRREIVRFILTGATQRSKDVQALLRLNSIDQARATLKTAQNKLGSGLKAAEDKRVEAETRAKEHLGVDSLSVTAILEAVNPARETLGLEPLIDDAPEMTLDEGVGQGGPAKSQPTLRRETARQDLDALTKAIDAGPATGSDAVVLLSQHLQRVRDDAEFRSLVASTDLVRTGLDLLSEPSCPLCDVEWDMDELRAHLEQKLRAGREAQAAQGEAEATARGLASTAVRIASLVQPVASLASKLEVESGEGLLNDWAADLEAFAERLRDSEARLALVDRLETGWANIPSEIEPLLEGLADRVDRLPDQDPAISAAAFLGRAQDRYSAYREAENVERHARRAADASKAVYKAYVDAAEAELTGLYEEVEARFTGYYRRINSTDEGSFQASLQPAKGKLDLAVDFYDRGLFPPGAYHSEGHQDGMGVCLYLALMSHLLEERFSLSVLDDVVMSVDSEHRREFCHLLTQEFPDTQFVVTTHDRVWAAQLRSAGLASSRSTIAFHSWTIDSGPIVEDVEEVWEEIESDLAKGDVPAAAANLRRYLEHVARELAGNLVARPPFRQDNSYDLGDLLPAAVAALKDRLGEAAKAAQSWGDEAGRDEAAAHKKAVGQATHECNIEQWVVNKAVHYNEWADFSAPDFKPVVAAFRELLRLFCCGNSDCESWIYVTPTRGQRESLRCVCGKVNYNLRPKGK